MRQILIDSGILLSYYQQQEPLHQAVVDFFDQTAAQLITSPISTRGALAAGFRRSPREERLDVAEILSLDSDFDVYRRFRREPSAAFRSAEHAATPSSGRCRPDPPTIAAGRRR